jgi:hypothetical protein
MASQNVDRRSNLKKLVNTNKVRLRVHKKMVGKKIVLPWCCYWTKACVLTAIRLDTLALLILYLLR